MCVCNKRCLCVCVCVFLKDYPLWIWFLGPKGNPQLSRCPFFSNPKVYIQDWSVSRWGKLQDAWFHLGFLSNPKKGFPKKATHIYIYIYTCMYMYEVWSKMPVVHCPCGRGMGDSKFLTHFSQNQLDLLCFP